MEPMPSAPHLLYVAWGYPPCRGSGVYRAWATANAFVRSGWRVTVLTAPRETFTMSTGIDSSLEATIDPRIDVVRVPFDDPKFANDIRAWSGFRARTPELWNVWQARSSARSFPEPKYGGWRGALERAARDVHSRHPVDLVIGTANPNVDFIPGHVLHERHGVPYVMDYRDAWQLDVFGGGRITPPGGRADRWERTLIDHAEQVWFVNEPIRAWHAELYPADASRFRVVMNGYDEGVEAAPRSNDHLVFGYVGTLTGALPLDELLAGWQLARSTSDLVARARMELWGHLNHTGIPSEAVASRLDALASNGIEYCGPVEKRSIADVYARFDALVLILGTGRYVTSGKVFEYAATGLPIVSVHDPANAASDVLRDAAQWTPAAALTGPAIAAAFVETAERAVDWSAEQRRDAQGWATRFQREEQLTPRIAELRDLVDRNRAKQEHADA
jgi:glycosyltransferase involved in cell wall biosynthesis